MKLIDIHSHILPAVDDGAADLNEALSLLEEMKKQGITDVIATPHFIASEHNLEEYLSLLKERKAELSEAAMKNSLPNIYLGSEVYYFRGIGKTKAVKVLTLNGSKYLLLELWESEITKRVIEDIERLRSDLEIVPIIAHIERYTRQKGFKKLLSLIDAGVCYAQLNASSILSAHYKKISYKLIKKGYISFLATDSHSVKYRPPVFKAALEAIEKDLGKSYADRLQKNLIGFCKEITEQ